MPSQTPLHDWHTAHGAKMVDFSGWRMPLWYPSGAVAEHLAVILAAGLFDTSHMSFVKIEGRGAFDLLQYCFSQDIALAHHHGTGVRHCHYGVFLDEQGRAIDDAILYEIASDAFIVIVNAGMGGAIVRHLAKYAGGSDVVIQDISNQLGKIDLQGSRSARILAKILREPETALAGLSYFTFKGQPHDLSAVSLIDGTPLLLSHTGYTGEFGFELCLPRESIVKAWEMIIEAGGEFGLIPCGLAARDSLRAGAGLPLAHQDLGPWPFVHNPWTFALPFKAEGPGFAKNFLGAEALRAADGEWTQAYVGFDPRKVSLSDPAVVIDQDDREIGVVLTSVADMAIGRTDGRIYSVASPDKPAEFKPLGLCCGFVRVKHRLEVGLTVTLKDRRRSIKAEIVADIRPDRTAHRPIAEMI